MMFRKDAISSDARKCQWINLREALHHFVTYTGPTQSQQHIKPLHWYVACRLVLEGGFRPEDITPRPPFSSVRKKDGDYLVFDATVATGSERTILGGLKTKNVDVVVTLDGIGPVVAVSCKGMTGAFRNLTNRMEETIGECTNLHITYPAMVIGYMFVIRANRAIEEVMPELLPEGAPPAQKLGANDIAIREGGEPVETIFRFHSALRELTGRRGIRDDVSRYEAITLAMIDPHGDGVGKLSPDFPPSDSALRMEQFFQTLYLRYDERYVFGAPDLKHVTRRLEWSYNSSVHSSLLTGSDGPALDYELRTAAT